MGGQDGSGTKDKKKIQAAYRFPSYKNFFLSETQFVISETRSDENSSYKNMEHMYKEEHIH